MIHRGTSAQRRSPGPFQCLSCKAYVTGTQSGHCPKCGFVPPAAPELPRERARASLVMYVFVVLGLVWIIWRAFQK